MYKISWEEKTGDRAFKFVLVPDVETLFSMYHILTGYGRGDGCTPVNIQCTNLDGVAVDMKSGMQDAAAFGTYGRH